MKFVFLIILVLLSFRWDTCAETKFIREHSGLEERHLADDDYGFLVIATKSSSDPNKSWCITASNGVDNNPQLGFDACDFDSNQDIQLFRQDSEGRIHSKVKDQKCIYASRLAINGVPLRIADCNKSGAINQLDGDFFFFPSHTFVHLLASIGNSATTIVKQCENKDRYYFDFVLPGVVPSSKFRNVIILIPDGCDDALHTLARWYAGKPLAVDVLGGTRVLTHSSNSIITDSAAAATAYACGHKTSSGFVGVGPRRNDLLSIYENNSTTLPTAYAPIASVLEAAKYSNARRSVGLVVTSSLSHATPAAFSSHIDNREKDEDIMEQLVHGSLDVAFGGGRQWLLPEYREDNQNLEDVLISRGVKIVYDKSELRDLKTTDLPAWGLFADGASQKNIDRPQFGPDQPSLVEMTEKAIELLSVNKNGFLLVVEGSQVDSGGHYNDAISMVTEILAFDDAVETSINFAKRDSETLVLIFPDHDTGGMSIANNLHGYAGVTVEELIAPLKGMSMSADALVVNKLPETPTNEQIITAVNESWGMKITNNDVIEIRAYMSKRKVTLTYSLAHVLGEKYTYVGFTTHGHTGESVPVWFFGADPPVGLIDNTDLAILTSDALGVDLAKTTSELFVDLSTTSLSYEVKGGSVTVSIIGSAPITLPFFRDYFVYDSGEKTCFDGVTIYAEKSEKVYVSQDAIDKIKKVESNLTQNSSSRNTRRVGEGHGTWILRLAVFHTLSTVLHIFHTL
eukprot:scaffold61195_cov58-Attheya_sp.AAC.3